MSSEYIVRPISWLVAPRGETSIFGEQSFRIEIDDEGGGEFVTVRDMTSNEARKVVAIDGSAWRELSNAIGYAFEQIKMHEGQADE